MRHVYGALHTMFERALAVELSDANPCAVHKNALPKKIDKDPSWRSGAIFTREEVEQILAAPSIPADRRAVYAIMFLGGLRFPWATF